MSTRISIYSGNFGSGKSELAIARAIADGATLVDMDVVNPYFRSSNDRRALERMGVRVIAPPMARTSAGLFTLPPDIAYIFDNDVPAVIDVGGDAAGAIALGRYREEIVKAGYEMYFVINARRPRTTDADGVLEVMGEVVKASGMTPTALINNTNLAMETTFDDVLFGQSVAEEVADRTGIPLKMITMMPGVDVPGEFMEKYGEMIVRVKPRLRLSWFDE